MSDRGLDLARGIRVAMRTNATAYAYSVFITACFGVADTTIGGRDVTRIFVFVLGATSAFALSETIASRGFRDRVRPEASDVVMLGSAMAVVSVTAAVAVSLAASSVVRGMAGWFAAPFAGTATYVVVAGLEMALARRREEEDPPERER